MDRNAKIAFGVLALAQGFGLYNIWLLHKRANMLLGVAETHIQIFDRLYQERIDIRFQEIADEYDE